MQNPMFRVESIKKSFDGFQATNDVSFSMEAGEVSAIIGPNGAGKTTLFNLITGHLKPDEGHFFFQGREITSLPPYKICRLGMGRSFQITNIFPRLSVYENIQVAVMAWKQVSRNIFQRASKALTKDTKEIIESVGLWDKREMIAGLLSHGDQRRLEFGITLGSHPSFLLLDEPTAGMSPAESSTTVELVRQLVERWQLTLLFIEHDMSMVFDISRTIRVLHMGSIIAEGSPEEIKANNEVQRIYLGEEV